MTIQRQYSNPLGRNPEISSQGQAVVNGKGIEEERWQLLKDWGDSLYNRVGQNPNVSAAAVGEKMGANMGVSSNPLKTENYPALAGEIPYSPDSFDEGTRVADSQVSAVVYDVRETWAGKFGGDIGDLTDLKNDVVVRSAAERARKDMMAEAPSETGAIGFEDERHVARAEIGRKVVKELLAGNTSLLDELPHDTARVVGAQAYELGRRYGGVDHMPNEDLARIGRYLESVPRQSKSENSPAESGNQLNMDKVTDLRSEINKIYNKDQQELAA